MRQLAIAAVLLVLALGEARAHAEDAPFEASSPITDRFALRAIFFNPAVTSDVRLDANGGASNGGTTGTPISGENDLGFQSRPAQGRMELMFRLRQRGRVRFEYLKIDRSGDRVLGRTIAFGHDVYTVNDRVTSGLDWRTMRFTYTYSFIRNERFEVGLGFGIDAIQARAVARVPARSIGEEATGAAPFPTVALDSTWAISKRWALNLRGNYLKATVDNFSGSLADYHTDLQYRWRENLQFGAGYSINRVILDVSDRSFPGHFSLYTRGPELFVRASF